MSARVSRYSNLNSEGVDLNEISLRERHVKAQLEDQINESNYLENRNLLNNKKNNNYNNY